MKYEKSCGAVIFRKDANGWNVLLIRHARGKHISYPKGHMEAGETEHETALREIREEVGLDVTLLDGFRMADEYPLPEKPGVTKRVVYYLAESAHAPLVPQPGEVVSAAWMTYDEAMARFQFDLQRRVLQGAVQSKAFPCFQSH